MLYSKRRMDFADYRKHLEDEWKGTCCGPSCPLPDVDDVDMLQPASGKNGTEEGLRW
jgi:hypothetical protein